MVTIKDLANYTKISKSTISRYLNNGYVSPEKKELISKAIEELGYTSNMIAKSLKTNQSMMIALIVPSVTNYFFSNISELIQQKISKVGYNLVLYTSNNDIDLEKKIIEQVLQTRADGLIVSTGSKDCVKSYENLKVPIVALDREISENIPLVISNNTLGSYELTMHLKNKGCKNILFIESANEQAITSKYRKKGFLSCALENNITTKVINDKDIEKVLANKEIISKYDGIMVWNDQTAFEVSSILYKNNVIIGKEVLLTGYDDTDFSKYMNPPLTTAQQPVEQIADKTIETLLKLIKGENMANTKIEFHNKIIRRESTGD